MATSLYKTNREDGKWSYEFPDILTFQKEPFATVIPGRSGEFKVHKSEGMANSALSHHKQGAKYKRNDKGEWEKVWEFYEPELCESCGLALDDNRDKNPGWRSEWLRSPLHKGSYLFAPYLCLNCFKAENEIVEDRQAAKKWQAEERRRKEWDAKFAQAATNNEKKV